jgi:multiple sugar transport system ATP-binding protein
LSGGQRQRVAIGRAIVRQPKVFLFDEPLSNLDAQLRAQMRTEIKKLHQRLGATIIYVTHDQVEAMTLADRIAVLSAGRLMQYGRPTEVYDTPAALFVAGFTGSPAMNLQAVQVLPTGLQLGPDCSVAMPASWLARAGAAKRHVLGIRPEDVHLTPAPSRVAVPARVVLTELLGAETLVTFGVGEVELVARCPSHYGPRPGTQTQVYLESTRLHLFDADSGSVLP